MEKNKDGSHKTDKWGRWTYEILEGETELTNPFTHRKSFNRDTINNRGWDNWRPFLCFDYTITTNQFHTTNYKKPLSKDRIRLHEEIMNLHNKGWGYTKIHRHLIKNEFKIGKSRTTVDSIIRKIKKREEFLSHPVIDKIGNFRIMMMKIKYNLR